MSDRRRSGIRRSCGSWAIAGLEWPACLAELSERRVYMNSRSESQRLIVGISGASGIAYGIEALKQLRMLGIETHLVVSKSAILTLSHESTMKYNELCALA